ncbi:MAG: ABC transporter permease [Opitutales bacterium]
MKDRTAYLLMFCSLPVVWYLVVWIFRPEPFLFPPLDLVLEVIWEDRADFWMHTLATLKIAMLGYLFSNLVALALALSYLYLPWLESFASPWTVLIKNMPLPVYAGILIVTLGDTLAPKVIIVVLFTFFPILANLNKGLKSVDPVLLDRMRSLNASRWQVFAKARWPFALPYYLAAHEIAFTASIIGAIVAEWFFSLEGLGYLILNATNEFRADRLYAVALIASLISIGAYGLVRLAEHRLTRWKHA